MKKINGTITGFFITQCLIGKINIGMNIYTTDKINTQNTKDVIELMKDRKYVTKQYCVKRYDNLKKEKIFFIVSCQINNMRAHIYHQDDCLLNDDQDVNVEKFLREYIEYNCSKNMYSFATNEIYIDRMQEIFAKVTNISRFENLDSNFSIMHENGFRFYKSDADKKIMSNEEILHSFYNIVRAQKQSPVNILKNYKHKIKNGKIYSRKNPKFAIFDIINGEPIDDECDKIIIRTCEFPEKCNITLLCPDASHYHCEHYDDSDSGTHTEEYIDRTFILVTSNI